YTQVPDLLSGRELEELDHGRTFTKMRATYPQAVQVADSILMPHRQKAAYLADNAGLLRAFLWILFEDLKRPARWLRRRRAFAATGAPRKVRRELALRTGRMLIIQRRRVLAPRAQLLLHSWKKVHVPFSIIMAALAVHHIWKEFPKTL